jgi:predicted RNase H-like nuclease
MTAPEPLSTFIGVDLAWTEGNRSGIAVARGDARDAELMALSRDARSFDEVADRVLASASAHTIVAIDAPLIVNNDEGCRPCERALSDRFQKAFAGAHPSNRRKFGTAGPPLLAAALAARGFRHAIELDRAAGEGLWMIEVYPHPAFVQLFALEQRILYKKGSREQKTSGLQDVLRCVQTLEMRDPRLRGGAAGERLAREFRSSKETEDQLDAWFCAYLAQHVARWGSARNEVFGDLEGGYIVVPRRDEVGGIGIVPAGVVTRRSAPGVDAHDREERAFRAGRPERAGEGARSPMHVPTLPPDGPGIDSHARRARRGTTAPGFINRNRQENVRATGLPGTDHGQSVYVLRCGTCRREYGVNGSGIFQAKCPHCQHGAAGLPY